MQIDQAFLDEVRNRNLLEQTVVAEIDIQPGTYEELAERFNLTPFNFEVWDDELIDSLSLEYWPADGVFIIGPNMEDTSGEEYFDFFPNDGYDDEVIVSIWNQLREQQ